MQKSWTHPVREDSPSFGLVDGAIAELDELYVLPEVRDRGLERALVVGVARWARQRGCAQLDDRRPPRCGSVGRPGRHGRVGLGRLGRGVGRRVGAGADFGLEDAGRSSEATGRVWQSLRPKEQDRNPDHEDQMRGLQCT